MLTRVLVPVVTLVLGGGVGFAACWFNRPAPIAVVEPPRSGEEVVVEVRVKLPPGAVGANDFRHSSSSSQQGTLINTGQRLDLAIEGQGFFQLTLPSGETVYTRDGVFGQNPRGKIVTKQGYLLTPQITIPQDAINVAVGTDGTVNVTNAMGQVSVLGQLELATFTNPGWLKRDERGWYEATAECGVPHVCTPGMNGSGLIRQGFRERQVELDAVMLTDLVRAVVQEQRTQVRVER